MSLLSRIKAASSAFTSDLRHPQANGSWMSLMLPNTRVNYESKVGDGLGSNVFMAPLLGISRAFPEARVAVVTEGKNGQQDIDPGHEAARLLMAPNPFFSWSSSSMAAVVSWVAKGDVYYQKARDKSGRVRQLWWRPHWMMRPRVREGSKDFISYYEYAPGGGPAIELPVEDVVHLRFGVNPRNTREGYGCLFPLFREIFNDDESSNMVAAILANGGVPGMLISPKEGVKVDRKDMAEVKQYVLDMFTGDNKGKPMAMMAPTEITEFGYDPKKLDVSATRNVSEERVCAMVGWPAALAGFGSGMDQTKVGATMQELVKLGWYGCINPMQDAMAEEWTRNLREDFALKDNQRIIFDRRQVRALQDDIAKRNTALTEAVRGSWMKRGEARKMADLNVTPEDDVYLVPLGVTLEGPGAPEPEPVPAALAPKPPEPAAPSSAAPEKAASSIETKGLSRVQAGILRAHAKLEAAMSKKLEARMLAFFHAMGAAAEAAYLNASKADEDELRIEQVFQQMDMPARRDEMNGIFGAYYVAMHKENVKLLAAAGIVTDVPDNVAFQVLSAGGTRAGLVDLTQKGKERALNVVKLAHDEGLGIPETARLLREAIPAGPWTSTKIRADVIARTETRFAQTVSSLRCYEAAEGIDSVMVLDARLGPTDAECEAMNGVIATFAEAQALMEAEHPNGTRDIVPHFGGIPS